MKRREWTFDYSVAEVASVAEERSQYHARRVVFWADEREAAKKAIEEKGIEVREYEITGGQRAEVVVDPTLANRLSEAQGKIKSHGAKAEEYENWHAVLLAAQDHVTARLSLDEEDVRYFGLHGSDSNQEAK